MSAVFAPPDLSVPVMQVLHQAQLALGHGDMAHSLALAKSALTRAQAAQDLPAEARALLSLAQADRLGSRFRRAQETAQRAATLFQMCEDPRGEAEALATLSHTLSVMGHSEEGVEAALLGLKLNSDAPALSLALSYNSLGGAYTHGWSFERADAAYQRSIALLEDNGHWVEAYLPRVNQRSMEVARCFFDRYYQGQFRSLGRLGELRRASARTAQVPPNLLVFQGTHLKTQTLMGLSDGFEACWLGNLSVAQSHADFAQAAETRGEANPSVTLVEMWLRAEIAWAAEDWPLAEYHCHRMMQLAMSIDNEYMVSIAYLLLGQILSAQPGKERAAQAQLRALKLRENELRHAAMQQREERIEWQLQARASRATARRLAQHAQHLEQLAMEDPLTGLFNRRYLERMVPDLLRKGSERGLSPAMAFVDVDFFKRINDQFSHRMGDAVLQELGHILRSLVREGDVPVRLGGDEFVVAFAHVEEAAAHGLAQRIQDVVEAHPWSRLHPELSVSVSVGVAGAHTGDCLENWLHRCDMGMYMEKDSRHQGLA